jgi:hypothetical protein
LIFGPDGVGWILLFWQMDPVLALIDWIRLCSCFYEVVAFRCESEGILPFFFEFLFIYCAHFLPEVECLTRFICLFSPLKNNGKHEKLSQVK